MHYGGGGSRIPSIVFSDRKIVLALRLEAGQDFGEIKIMTTIGVSKI